MFNEFAFTFKWSSIKRNKVYCILFVCFNYTVFTLIRVWQDLDNPLRLQTSRLDGKAPPPPRYPSSPLTYGSCEMDQKRKDKKRKENVCKSTAASPPHLSYSLWPLHTAIHLGGNFPTSVAAIKFITAWSPSSMENSSEICTGRHLPAFQPVAFPTSFHCAFCWSLHRLQWWKRWSHVRGRRPASATARLAFVSSRCPNRFMYVPIGTCLLFGL